jgi:uncharacterized protein
MKRTSINNNQQLVVFASQLVARQMLAAGLGVQQYQGKRNLYEALGYPLNLTFDDYFSRYTRQEIAKAVIDRPVKATWQGDLELIETEDPNMTPFEEGWKDLNWRLGLKTRLARVDKLTGIGQYGVLLLGLNDVRKPEDFRNPVSKGPLKLLYVRPFSEKTAPILSYETNPRSPRYGSPLTYNIEVQDISSGGSTNATTSMFVEVHHSRVIHIVDDNLESEILGTPRLQPVFNRLLDIEKIVGGDAEMFWRGARPGYQGKIDKDFHLTPAMEAKLQDQIDEYEHNLRRMILNEGISFEDLKQQMSDPKSHFDIQISALSAETGIPKRVLMGSERGELASSQDADEWKTFIQSRREDHAEPRIIRPFVDRIIKLGIIPAPEKYYRIDWLDLFSISEKDRVEIGKSRANAIREYTTNPLAEAIMPPKAFFELCLGLSTGQIELVEHIIAEGISDEQKDLMEEIRKIQEKMNPNTPKALPAPKSSSNMPPLRKTAKRTS